MQQKIIFQQVSPFFYGHAARLFTPPAARVREYAAGTVPSPDASTPFGGRVCEPSRTLSGGLCGDLLTTLSSGG